MRLLGPVQGVTRDGLTLDLPSITQRRLLAMLALEAGRPIRSELLAEELSMSAGSIRTTVSRLRRILGEGVLRTDAVGYRLDANVDSDLFCQALSQDDGGRDRLQQLESALAWWRGPAIEEFHHEAWARSESTRLTELHAAAVEDHAAELMMRARWTDAIAALERHIASHPLRDHPRGLLMQALAGCGRQADALAAYRTYRAYLATEVGTEPSARVRDIGRHIAKGVEGSAPTTTTASASAPAALSSDLPRYRSSLIGREADLESLAEHIRSTRLLTLTGVGGVGKSRLAAALAHRAKAAGGATWFVELAALRDPADIVSAIASAVGAPAADGLASLTQHLRAGSGLLVIDNCEHVLDAAAEIVDAITLACPAVVIVTTSREFLALEGEQVFHVGPLDPLSTGADLLEQRALAAGAEIRADDRRIIEEICQFLDGIPLAIEIAATRAGGLGLRALRSSLENRFTLLAAGRRGGAERQQTLGKAIDWSYQLLRADEQRLFRNLAMFAGGFEIDAAEQVMSRLGEPARSVPLLLSSLIARSMLEVNLRPAVTRYRILEPLRAFALEALAEAGESESAATAHAGWIASLTDVPMQQFHSRRCHDAAVRLEREVDNWRAALAFAYRMSDSELASQLCGAPTSVFLMGHPEMGAPVIRLDSLLARDDVRRASIATAYGSLGINTLASDDVHRCLVIYDECDPGDTTGTRRLLHSGYLMMTTADSDTALKMLGDGIIDPVVPTSTVDYMAAIAVYIACATHRRDLLEDGWLTRARAAAEHSDVPATRLMACRALAAAVARNDPSQSREWTRRALDVRAALPLIERRLSSATLSQLLDGESPVLAALRLRELMVEQVERGYTDDQTVLIASAALLARCHHASADDVIASIASTAVAGHLALTVEDLAGSIERGTPLTRETLRRRVLAGLADLAGQEVPGQV